MTFKHYDVSGRRRRQTLRMRLPKIREGWQPYGGPFSSYTDDGAALIQAIVAEGDVSTPVVVKPTWRGHSNQRHQRPGYYFLCSGGAVKQHGIW